MILAEALLREKNVRLKTNINEAAFKDLKEVTSSDWTSAVKSQHSGVKIDTDKDNKDPNKKNRLVAVANGKMVGWFDDKVDGRCSVTMKDGTGVSKPIKGFKESNDTKESSEPTISESVKKDGYAIIKPRIKND